jgi:hypothetical protein
MEGLFSGVGVRIAATEELLWRCMAKKGFRYVKRPAPKRDVNPTMSDPDYGLSPAEAQRHGYRTAALLNQSESQPDPYKNQTPAERQRWGQAFFGPDSRNGEREAEIKLAVADAKCEQQIDYTPQRKRLEDLYYTAALRHYEPEIAAVHEMNKEVLARARTILAGRTP